MEKISIKKEVKSLLHNLVWLRNHYNLSKEDMARILRIDMEMWENIECGKLPRGLSVEVFYIIKEQFHINPSDLLYKMFD